MAGYEKKSEITDIYSYGEHNNKGQAVLSE